MGGLVILTGVPLRDITSSGVVRLRRMTFQEYNGGPEARQAGYGKAPFENCTGERRLV
jgi:hypothetical protein